MQKSIRILRVVLPILFFGFLILIVASWKRTKMVRDKATTEPVVRTRNEAPRIESKEFDDTQTVAGRIVAHIHAKRMVSYESNWSTLEDVQMTIFRPNGLSYQLLCPNAQVNSQTKEADAKGGVRVRSSDGVDVRTAEIHFDGSRLTNHIPVQFIVDRWHGNAGALDLDVQSETLRLFETVEATMVPEQPDEDPMTLKGKEGLFRRHESDVAFTDHVVMTRLDDVLNSDLITGRFTPDHKQLLDLQGTGHVDIVLVANSAVGNGSVQGRKEITCDRFFSELGPTGTISAINTVADPGLVHVVIDGPPKRDIVSKVVRVGLKDKVVSDLKAEQQVVMKELGEIPRNLSADHVTLYFDPATRQASTAAIEGNFKYSDPRNTAIAIRADYDIVSDRVLLTAEPGFDPTVTTDGNIVKAKQIEFSPRAQTAKATGEVIAQIVSKTFNTGVAADNTSIFPSNKPVFVNSDLLLMRQANKTAVFSGNVRAWQDLNTVFAQELQVQGAGDTMTAHGNVRTVLYNTSPAGAQAKVPMLSFSDQLSARKSDRRIDLSGSVRIEDDQRTMTSDRAAFFFDANRKMEHVEADQKVVLIERPTGRKGTGDKAIYYVNKRLIYVDGNPATVTAPTGNLSGEHILYDLARNKVEVLSPNTGTKASYKTPG